MSKMLSSEKLAEKIANLGVENFMDLKIMLVELIEGGALPEVECADILETYFEEDNNVFEEN